MSKQLDVSAMVSPNIFFTTSGTLNFMQSAWSEVIIQVLINQIGVSYNASVPYILYGCVGTVGITNTTITAGAIFFNGEVFIIPAQVFTNASGGNVIICNLNVINTFLEPGGASCDPASFSDGTPRDVHNNRSISYTTGTTGSGLFDFSALVPDSYTHNIPSTPSSLNGMVVTFDRSKSFRPAAIASSNIVNLNNSGANPGSEVLIFVNCTSGQTITFSGSVGIVLMTGASSLTMTNSTTVFIRIKYLANSSGIGLAAVEVYNPA